MMRDTSEWPWTCRRCASAQHHAQCLQLRVCVEKRGGGGPELAPLAFGCWMTTVLWDPCMHTPHKCVANRLLCAPRPFLFLPCRQAAQERGQQVLRQLLAFLLWQGALCGPGRGVVSGTLASFRRGSSRARRCILQNRCRCASDRHHWGVQIKV